MTISQRNLGWSPDQAGWSSSDVGQKVPRKANDLLKNDAEEGHDGRVFGKFFKPAHVE